MTKPKRSDSTSSTSSSTAKGTQRQSAILNSTPGPNVPQAVCEKCTKRIDDEDEGTLSIECETCLIGFI